MLCIQNVGFIRNEQFPFILLFKIFFAGNGVTLIVDTQQLDKCNNNLSEENEALGKSRSKTSETLSKHSSNSSSGPLSSSSSTLSSSSDVVSIKVLILNLIRIFFFSLFVYVYNILQTNYDGSNNYIQKLDLHWGYFSYKSNRH